MEFVFEKQPSEKKRIGISFKNELRPDDSVASATYVVTDAVGGVVTTTLTESGTNQISDEDGDTVNETASIVVQAGADKADYKLTILATTANGEKIEGDITIIVRER